MTLVLVDDLFLQTDELTVNEIKYLASELFPNSDFSRITGYVPIQTRDKFNLYIGNKCIGDISCYDPEVAEAELIVGGLYIEHTSHNVSLNQKLYDLLERFDCHR